MMKALNKRKEEGKRCKINKMKEIYKVLKTNI
jgi:hypothetical protein